MKMIGLAPACVAPERSYLSLTLTGFDTVCAARIFHKLMKRLGFNKFYAQGGDWGCLITTNMAQLEPRYDLTPAHYYILAQYVVAISLIGPQRYNRIFCFLVPQHRHRLAPEHGGTLQVWSLHDFIHPARPSLPQTVWLH